MPALAVPPQNCVVNLLAQVEIAMLRNISSDEELHERMTKFWSMLLFVGALMSSMFFGGYVNPMSTSTCGPEAARNFMGFMLGTGVCCGLGTMMFAALFTQYINAVSTAATRAWLLKNLWVMILPMFFLVCGIGCMSMVVLFVAGCTYDNVVLTFMFLGGSFGLFLCVLVIWRLSATTGNEYADTAEYLKRKNAKYTAPDKLTPASTPKGTSLDFSNVEEISLAEEGSSSASASTSPPKAAQQSSISSFFGAGEKQTERADGTYA